MEGAIIIEDDSAKTPEAIKHEIAVDGNYLSQVDTWVNNWKQKDYFAPVNGIRKKPSN